MEFVAGLELSRRLYREGVRPVLDRHFPGLVHSAGLIGAGSEVLGFDTPRSTDHDWGPRLHLFLGADDLDRYGERIDDRLSDELPPAIAGYPTSLVPAGERGTRHMRATPGRVRHGVTIATPQAWLSGHLGFDPLAGVTTGDWLATPTQTLAEVTGGGVHHDGLGTLERARRALAWYPDHVWRYVLASQWQRIAQEEPFVGRCGEVGDELGSAVVAARLVRDLMRLCLLMGRVYPPYAKWLGSAFARLPYASALGPALTEVLAARDWHDRENHLVTAYETVAAAHNELALTKPLDPAVRPFHDRPFRVLGADRFAAALLGGPPSTVDPSAAAFSPDSSSAAGFSADSRSADSRSADSRSADSCSADSRLAARFSASSSSADDRLAGGSLIGAIDHIVDNTDVLTDRVRSRAVLKGLHPMP